MKKKIHDAIVIPKQPTLKLKSVSLDEVVMGHHYLMLIDGHYRDGYFSNSSCGLKFYVGTHWEQVFYDGSNTEFGGVWELFPNKKIMDRVRRRKMRRQAKFRKEHPELFRDEDED